MNFGPATSSNARAARWAEAPYGPGHTARRTSRRPCIASGSLQESVSDGSSTSCGGPQRLGGSAITPPAAPSLTCHKGDLRRLNVHCSTYEPSKTGSSLAIEELVSRLDAVELGLRRGLQQLDRLKSAVLVEAFGSNRCMPSHWNWTTIVDVAEVRGGIQKQPKRRSIKNPAPFLRVANVIRGKLILDEVRQIELFDDELQIATAFQMRVPTSCRRQRQSSADRSSRVLRRRDC